MIFILKKNSLKVSWKINIYNILFMNEINEYIVKDTNIHFLILFFVDYLIHMFATHI